LQAATTYFVSAQALVRMARTKAGPDDYLFGFGRRQR
jgi:hypothetical protein